MQSAKRGYLEHKLLHSELTAVLSRPSTQPASRLKSSAASSSSSRDGGGTGMGRRVLVAAEAQHCLRLHPEATLLGVTTDHLRHSAGSALTGVNVCVCVCVCCRYAVLCICTPQRLNRTRFNSHKHSDSTLSLMVLSLLISFFTQVYKHCILSLIV